MNRKSFIQIESTSSAPIIAGDQEIVLQSRAVSIKLPGVGGVVWNRPTAVIARTRDGRAQKIIVRDVTRLAQLLIFALGIAGALMIATRHHD
ncbi:MAG: hypothetical protein HZC40_11510 [Chloroflexi bacterium]|nr:hypothetical protein [Chloroflexota bacterium]